MGKQAEKQKEKRIKDFRKLIRLVQPAIRCLRHKKHVLLFCSNDTMESHILDYYETTKDMEELRCFLYYPRRTNRPADLHRRSVERMLEGRKIQEVNYGKVLLHCWDLFVCPDTEFPFRLSPLDAPAIYVNHGMHIVSLDGGENLYAYDPVFMIDEDGHRKFDAMFEPNRNHVKVLSQERPELKGILRHVGYKFYRDIQLEVDKKEEYRRQLGVEPDETLVAMFSTWKSDSLFQRVGPEIIGQAKEMMHKKYRFILSAHAREYRAYDPDIVPVGPWIDSLVEEGFLVRHPEEDFLPYLMAADVVVCDHSSFYELVLIAGKPLIFSEFPKDIVWKHSIAAKLVDQIPVFTSDSNLEEMVEQISGSEEYQNLFHNYSALLKPPGNDYKRTVIEITREILR